MRATDLDAAVVLSRRSAPAFARRVILGVIIGVMPFLLLASPVSGGDDFPITSQLIQADLEAPTYVASIPGDTRRLFVVEKYGRVRLILDGVLQAESFLDIDALVPDQDWNGMLGLCFDPNYQSNGYFYVQHTLSDDRLSVARYAVSDDPDVADHQSRETVLELPFPDVGHHVGGWIGFGPDGHLYIPLGDGGTSTNFPMGGALSQSLTEPWGKLLRVDVHGADAFPDDANRNYAIPTDNPFIGVGLAEIYALGLRNPFRADFDDVTGDLWIADVGRYSSEEVNFVAVDSGGGQNFGWNCVEGFECNPGLPDCDCGFERVDPVYEYPRELGCSISGGSVYNGCRLEGLQGRFFFGDWCTGRIWSARRIEGRTTDVIEHTSSLVPPGQPPITRITGIGVDGAGELVVVSGEGSLFRIEPEGKTGGCTCPGDFNGDGVVDGADIGLLLATWGTADPQADLDGSGLIDGADLGLLLGSWGSCV